MSSTIEEITSILGAERKGNAPATIDWILTDSRSLCFPEETLFFALKTKRNDGHKYIPDLYKKGVRNFVVNEIPQTASSYQDANFLIVPNPLKSLQRLASKHREQFQVPVIGITGSNGKRSSKNGCTSCSVRTVSLPVLQEAITPKSVCLSPYGS